MIFILFMLFVALAAWLAKPGEKELVYVFEKTGNYSELEKIYRKRIEQSFNAEDYQHWILALLDSGNPLGISEARKLLHKTSSKEVIDASVRFFLKNERYESLARWYEFLFLKTGDDGYLKKSSQVYSSIGDKNAQIKVLKRLFEHNSDSIWLWSLFSLGEKNYALDRLYDIREKFAYDQTEKLFHHLLWEKRNQEAWVVFKQLIGFEQAPSMQLLTDGLILVKRLALKEAEESILLRLIERDSSPKYRQELGSLYFEMDKIDAAIAIFKVLASEFNEDRYLDILQAHLSATGNIKQLASVLKERYEAKSRLVLLQSLYDIGEKDYVLDALEKRLTLLPLDWKLKYMNFLLWDGKMFSAWTVAKELMDSSEQVPVENLEQFLSLALEHGTGDDVEMLYISLYERTRDKRWLLQNAQYSQYHGKTKHAAALWQKLFDLTKEPGYLRKKLAIMQSSRFSTEKVNVLRQLVSVEDAESNLQTLFGVGDKNWVMQWMSDHWDSLSKKGKSDLLTYYLWERKTQEAYELVRDRLGVDNLDAQQCSNVLPLALYYLDAEMVQSLHKRLFDLTDEPVYLMRLAESYDYYGDPESAYSAYEEYHKRIKDPVVLELLAYYSVILGHVEKRVRYQRELLEMTLDYDVLQSLLEYYMENRGIKDCISLVKWYVSLAETMDKTDNLEDGYALLARLQILARDYSEAVDSLLKTAKTPQRDADIRYCILKVDDHKQREQLAERFIKTSGDVLQFCELAKQAESPAILFNQYFSHLDRDSLGELRNCVPTEQLRVLLQDGQSQDGYEWDIRAAALAQMMGDYKIAGFYWEKAAKSPDFNDVERLEYAKSLLWTGNAGAALIVLEQIKNRESQAEVLYYWLESKRINGTLSLSDRKLYGKVLSLEANDSLDSALRYWTAEVRLNGMSADIVSKGESIISRYQAAKREVENKILEESIAGKYYSYPEKFFENFSIEHESDIQRLRLYASYLMQRKNWTESEKVLNKVKMIQAQMDVQDAFVRSDLAFIRERNGDLHGALRLYEESLQLMHNNEIQDYVNYLKDSLSDSFSASIQVYNDVWSSNYSVDTVIQKMRVGLSASEIHEQQELWLYVEDLRRELYHFELGEDHHQISVGRNLKLNLSRSLYQDYRIGVTENARMDRAALSWFKSDRGRDWSLELSKNQYYNDNGDLADTTNIAFSVRQSISSHRSFALSFYRSALGEFHPERTGLFFSDYKAVTATWRNYRRRATSPSNYWYEFGASYDWNNISPVFSFERTWKTGLRFQANMSYDYYNSEIIYLWMLGVKRYF